MVRQRYSVFLLKAHFNIDIDTVLNLKISDDIKSIVILFEKERDRISTEIKGWSVEEYVNHNDEWKELKDRVKQLNRSIGILKREQDEK
jgi:5'(3')-deoxyribonucleotidase